ncbi:MAG: ribosome biogenesis GTP-binding protein YsxC [Gemmatimonadetes bacterium 13_2_20CM_69_8]|nr:MAG: ribosome biogenesis GTP-binding protein YsxC [Gemmatimonadetes bacterium 13_2_20CM_69_8]
MTDPRFVGSFPSADAPLDPPLPEIALLGRSNVGKSSLLNALAGRRIAKVSGTPGKTRALNVYHMTAYYLLDLPGYGYARAGQVERAAFRGLITHTLERDGLAGVVWLLDVRRDPSEEDRGMQDRLAARGTRVLAAVTKSDKLPRAERLRREQAIRTALGLDDDQIVLTSARSREGIVELREAVAELVRRRA